MIQLSLKVNIIKMKNFHETKYDFKVKGHLRSLVHELPILLDLFMIANSKKNKNLP